MKLIIDRFDGGYVVCEMPDGDFCDLPRKILPNANEGDIIEVKVLGDETEKRHKIIEEKARRLFED